MPNRKPTLPAADHELRIIGGEFRGRKLSYAIYGPNGMPLTRPMKHRVRESIFNLISTESKGRHAIDLFAGTGALGLEALSRGAEHATLIEKHVPTSRVIAQNIETLGVEARTTLLTTSAFLWAKRDLGKEKGEKAEIPWLAFCSPPYAFYQEQSEQMLALIGSIIEHAPLESIVVVEADERLDFSTLPFGDSPCGCVNAWDVRTYPPAVVGVFRKEPNAPSL